MVYHGYPILVVSSPQGTRLLLYSSCGTSVFLSGEDVQSFDDSLVSEDRISYSTV